MPAKGTARSKTFGDALRQRASAPTSSSDKPHVGFYRRYRRFAPNTVVTDREILIANFGYRGSYDCSMAGKMLAVKAMGAEPSTPSSVIVDGKLHSHSEVELFCISSS